MTTNQATWLVLAAALAVCGGAQTQEEDGGMDVVIAASADDVPARIRPRVAAYIGTLPEGHRAKVTIGQFFDSGRDVSSNQMEPYIYSLVPVNPKGREDGDEDFTRPDSSAPHRVVPWKDGKREGVEKHFEGWGRDRRVVAEIPWANDEVEGVRRTFHANGQLRSETPYRGGVPHGPSRTYDADGNVTRESVMSKGMRDGTLTDYWPGSGQVKRVIEYRDGKVHGVTREYYRHGRLKREIPFRDDMMHGEEKQYDAEGKLERTRYWRDGDPISQAEFNAR
jgi:antitoxin component YwqK of YwqJK toxin-antitoxin module